jgi:hypothetical protein
MHSKKVLKNCDLVCFIIDVENLGSHSLLKQGDIVLPAFGRSGFPFRLSIYSGFRLFQLSCRSFPVVSAISVIPAGGKN